MRISCDVDVVNRLLPSFNMKKKGKSSRAQLSVGRKPGAEGNTGEVFLMMCTKLDRNGAKYQLRNNIEQYFIKFVQQGKATIRFLEPPHDLVICHADPIQLKSFLSVVRLGHQGNDLSKVTLSSLAPASAKQVEKPKTKMVVLTRKDYPITTGFPTSLTSLRVSDCMLKRIDSRMLRLYNLRSLDLSGNHLKTLPDDFHGLDHLSELRLANNHLEDLPVGFCSGPLSRTLNLLDLSGNRLKMLRSEFCLLEALVTLRLDSNQLKCLPHGINRMTGLRFISAVGNKLQTLPASFTQLRLESLDLSGNEFIQAGPSSAIDRLQFPTLLECAAKAIHKHRVSYTEEDVGHLLRYLHSGKRCMCGNVCFTSHVHYLTTLDLRQVTSAITAIDQRGSVVAPCEAFLCSRSCFEKYQRNPYRSLWKKSSVA